MVYRAIVIYFAVQSMVVALPAASQHDGDSPGGGGTYYRSKSTPKHGGIPEVGRLPRTSVLFNKKSPPTVRPPYKFTPPAAPGINSHPARRLSAIDRYQPLIPHNINHNRLDEQISKDERAEKINSDLEKMIQFMTVLGQVDRYLSSKAKSFVSTLGRAMENTPDDHKIYDDNNKIMSSYDY